MPLPAYMIVEVTQVHDEARYARYREAVPASIAGAGGRYLARGGDIEVLAGAWRPGRIIVVEYPSVAAAAAWWRSPSYAALRALRGDAITANFIVVDGIRGDIAAAPVAPGSGAG
jgi:uncharacterized protein (DUF1330 family)